MPEGHTVHRTARHFQKAFAGNLVEVTSPQGRFSDARLISGSNLQEAKAIGKQLFLKFEPATLRIHLGIYGKWHFGEYENLPEPKGLVRARFVTGNQLADLRGPTACELLDAKQLAAVTARLGPDPLDKQADAERFIEKVSRSKTAIGQLLMDQCVIAGIGNVYRAELLFRAGINPYAAGNSLTKEQLVNLWLDAVALMPLGVKTGLMLTREGFLNAKTLKDDRYYVYKREGQPCRECGGIVSIALMATRKLYWCPSCQR